MKKLDLTKTRVVASLFLIWLIAWLLRSVKIPKILYLSTIVLIGLLLLLWNIRK